MKALALFATALLLIGCEDRYRYECQDPANAEKAECNRPACEVDGFCFDTLNGLPPKSPVVEQSPVVEEAAEPAAVVDESTGE
jgi:hypothetical protein